MRLVESARNAFYDYYLVGRALSVNGEALRMKPVNDTVEIICADAESIRELFRGEPVVVARRRRIVLLLQK